MDNNDVVSGNAVQDLIDNATDASVVSSEGKREKKTSVRSSVMKKIELSMDTNERQQQYVKAQEAKGGGIGLVFADAFIRGMRDIGYKSPAWALSEMTDNSMQAGATTLEIRFGFDKSNKSKAKPDMLAVIDNGAGMIAQMVSYAVRWGGTDRENDRHGFGRYGYGLPSSAVSMAKRYTVYSKTAHSVDWHAVTVDLEKLAAAANDLEATEKLLAPRVKALPEWVVKYERWGDVKGEEKRAALLDLTSAKSGTVIVLEDLDYMRRLPGWITMKSLRTKLLQHYGVVYRHWLAERRILVDGTPADVVDPLFLMPEGRYYAETDVMAQPVANRAFEVETEKGEKGVVRIRAALLPPNFQWANPRKEYPKNKRFDIIKEDNGLLMCREGRQIDCVSPNWIKFQNYDRNIKIEVDFDPVLDEHFGITTSKQQIVIDEWVWEKLRVSGKENGGLFDLIRDMRGEFKRMVAALAGQIETEEQADEPRPSEVAMEEAERFRVRRAMLRPEKVEEAKKNLEEVIEKIAKETGETREKVAEKVKADVARRGWEVAFDAIEEGPFYIPKRLGEQKRIIINTAHPFYTKMYDQAPEIKSALEVLLFVLADGEIDAQDEREDFYKAERMHWSTLLRHALDKLIGNEAVVDRVSMKQESDDGAAKISKEPTSAV